LLEPQHTSQAANLFVGLLQHQS